MLTILANRTFRHLFAAQVIALLGTGLLTIALALLAWDLAGPDAGMVLGTALAIKMVAYVGVAPIAAAFAQRVPRRAMLVTLDLIRAGIAVMLPFVTEVWQIYVLIFLLQAASAGFTPTFQATIPDVLTDERDYTRALSLSRLAYDLENLVSPMLAAALLMFVSFSVLFAGTVFGFLISAALVLSVVLPSPHPGRPRGIWDRTTRGLRLYLASPRLRGLLALNLAVATAGSMVIVNTVVIVQADLGLASSYVALAMAAFGGGSMIAALTLPRLLDRIADRPVMLAGSAMLVAGLGAGSFLSEADFAALLGLWAVLGFGYAVVQTPSGRLLRRSSMPEDRPAVFAAQFALSHLCWLITYPLAGVLGTQVGMAETFGFFALIASVSIFLALSQWPKQQEILIQHQHPDLPADHPHIVENGGIHEHQHPPMAGDEHAFRRNA